MAVSNVVSLVGAGISAVAAGGSLAFSRRAALHDRAAVADEVAVRYREPLLQAAFNLQTRLWYIARQSLWRDLFRAGSPSETEYAVVYTVYLVGQYLCWSEILRREAQFVHPSNRQRDRWVNNAMEEVRETFSTSPRITEPVLRVFRGEQRAVGEVMMTHAAAADRTGPRWDCMGYAAFVKALPEPDVARWFDKLQADVRLLATEPGKHMERLVALQNRLLDLIGLLDPRGDRVSATMRERL